MTGISKFKLARSSLVGTPIATSRRNSPACAAPDPLDAAMQQASTEMQKLLTPSAVSDLLGVAERTLERWRITGEGPRYVKLSRKVVRYLADDLAIFIADRLKANTAQ